MSDTHKLIQDLEADDESIRQQAHDTLIAQGREITSDLIASELPVEVVVDIIGWMPQEDAVAGFTLIVRMRNTVTPDLVKAAQSALRDLGVTDPKLLEDPPKPDCVSQIDIPIDDHWEQCRLSLEHRGGDYFPCYWLTVIIAFSAEGRQSETYTIRNTTKLAVDRFRGKLTKAGFKRPQKSVRREWEYFTYQR